MKKSFMLDGPNGAVVPGSSAQPGGKLQEHDMMRINCEAEGVEQQIC